jgi:hypothetical protein
MVKKNKKDNRFILKTALNIAVFIFDKDNMMCNFVF